ncbi:MAG: MFS transporter [Pseudonocardiaceae bacterium]
MSRCRELLLTPPVITGQAEGRGGKRMRDSAGLRQLSAGRAQQRTVIVLVGTQAAAGVGVAAGIALSPLFGVLADRIGRHRVLALGAALLVIAGGLTATAGRADAGQLTVGLVALGLGWSAGLVGGSALLVEAVPLADRPGLQGLSDVTMNIAGALGGVLAGVTVAAGSYALLGLATAALAALFVCAMLVHAQRWAAS